MGGFFSRLISFEWNSSGTESQSTPPSPPLPARPSLQPTATDGANRHQAKEPHVHMHMHIIIIISVMYRIFCMSLSV